MSLRRLAGARSYDRIAGYFCPSIFEVAGEALESVSGPIRMVCNSTIQAKVQEKRKWVAKDRFLEGLAVANILPGATAVQLGIFLGYARGGRRARGARSSSRRRSHWPCCSRSRVSLPQPVPAMRLGLGPPEIVLTAEEPTPEWTQKLGQAPTISASHSN
jgi:Chromate transporter